MRYRWIAGTAALVLAAGCTIADVTAAGGADVLVVEGVLRTDQPEQQILLHRSVRGAVSPGEPDAEVVVTGNGGARYPFSMAHPQSCLRVDSLYTVTDSVDIQATCYVSAQGGGYWVHPDSVYDLTVTTRRGELARGRTHVPASFQIVGLPFRRADDNGSYCTIPAGAPLSITWTQSRGAYGYLAPLIISGLDRVAPDSVQAPAELELLGLAISSADTTIVLPGEFGVFDRFSLDQRLLRYLSTGLPEGVLAQVVIAAADRNYINGVRGGSFNPSGQVRISSVVGDGRGVFGSLVPLEIVLNVGAQGSRLTCVR